MTMIMLTEHPLGIWTVDFIGSTKGFLRGEQYTVCPALLVDTRVRFGVIGCPDLPVSALHPYGPRGCIFVSVRSKGAYQSPLNNSP